MTDSFTMSLVAKAELLGWYVAGYTEREWEFSKHSPAGEDFYFTVTAEDSENVWYEVYKYAKNFDIDAHAEQQNRKNPTADYETLWNDAYDIQEMIRELANALEEFTEEMVA